MSRRSGCKLAKVNLPPYADGCDADPAKVACDYASTPLQKVVSKESEDKMAPEAAADKGISENPDKVEAWLPR